MRLSKFIEIDFVVGKKIPFSVIGYYFHYFCLLYAGYIPQPLYRIFQISFTIFFPSYLIFILVILLF